LGRRRSDHSVELPDPDGKEQTAANYRRLIGQPEVGVWLADTGAGHLVGFLTAGPCKLPVPDREPAAGEIRQLYLRGAVQGQGLGSALLRTGLDWLRARGHGPLYIGVWSGNVGAQRLYDRHGFGKVGEYDFPVGEHLDREFILKERAPVSGGTARPAG
ncbi:MAG: GNAT family N-acetyltransferase, partial [Gammaproteobacteria bacterium]|nr:GNAT family N-acetyltransferase [Gammaproteobacteria bacterium]